MPSIDFLAGVTAKATLILAVAGLLGVLMRRASASTRYFLWICALAAVLALPVISRLLPRWEIAVPVAAAAAPAATQPAVAANRALPAPAQPAPPHRAIVWPIVVWLAGIAIFLVRLVAGHARLALSLRHTEETPLPADLAPPRWVKLRRSSATDVPITCGVFAPAIVLPDSSQEWSTERWRVVLTHELTHARRKDPLIYLLAQITTAIYWFHPLCWLAVSRLRHEQERSCDDAVVRAGTAASAYAGHLVALARSVAPAGAFAVGLAMAAGGGLEQRVRALLDPRRSRACLSRRACLAGIALLAAAVIPLAALHAQAGRFASLSGSVNDASGAAVPNALVLLKNNTSHEEAARTNAAGEFQFGNLPAGTYSLEVQAPGFAKFTQTVVLPIAHSVKFTLAIGQISETVEVVGKGPNPLPTSTPHQIRVSPNVQAARLVSMVKPVYPPAAQAAGIEGTVLLRAVISTSGDLLGLSVINTAVDPELAQAAVQAVSQWHYQPTLLNGEPVEVVTTIAVTFRLD